MFGKLGPGWRWRRPGTPTGRITLAGALVAGVVAVAFGTGYTTTKALTNDDSAWLQKGDTIVHVNGPSGRYDAVVADRPTALAASVRDRLEIVETPNSQVYAADPVTHRVYRIDLSTMAPQSLGTTGTDVLAAGASHFVVNAANGTVTSFNPQTLTLSTPVQVPGGVASEAITPSGVAYIGSNDGSVTVDDNGKVTTATVGPRGHSIEVSVIGNTPIAIDTTDGQLHDLSSNGTPEPAIALPGQSGATVQLAPSLAGNTAWLIRGTQVVEVNPATGYSVQTTLPARDTFGAPLANAGDGYVPDNSSNQVLVYDSSLNLARRIAVPPGLPGDNDIEMVVKDGNVWADEPTSSEATVIHPNGTTQIVNKGTGDGVVVPGHGHQPVATQPAPATAAPAQGTSQTNTNQPSPSNAGQTSQPGSQAAASQAPPANTAPPSNTAPPTQLSPPTEQGSPTQSETQAGGSPQPASVGPSPVVAAAPPPLPTPPATPPTSTAPPASASGASPAAATTVVPTGLEGKALTTACQAVGAAQLTCASRDLGQAPKGQSPNVVTAVPKEGQTVPVHTSVEVDYYGTGAPVTVPQFTTGEDPQTYCSKIPAGLTCTPNDLKQGNPAGQVISTRPSPGTTVPYGSTVLANYYGTSAPILVPTPGQNGAPTDPKGYCTFADNLGFNCTAEIGTNTNTNGVQGLADPGQPINQVTSTNPPSTPSTGRPYGSQLTATYFTSAGVQVPNIAGAPTYSQACSTLSSGQLTCGSGDNQVAPSGAQPGVIAGSEQPAAGTVVATGSTVNFSYYGQVVVPNCSGQPASGPACPGNPGITWAGPVAIVGNIVPTSCNTITAQTSAAGSVVAAFTTVTPQYIACPATVGISEWHLTNPNMGKVHYLEAGTGTPSQPGSWAGGDIAYGGAYEAQGANCPAGTIALVGSELPFGNGLYHYAFTLGTGFTQNNWNVFDTVGCVFAPTAGACPSGTVGVYSYTIDNVDWSWTENPGGNGLQWCELSG